MASVGTINVDVTADTTQFQRALRNASDTIANFSYSMNNSITEGFVNPLKKAKFEFKDVARIIGGIVIAKTFYGALNAIRNVRQATIEFREELEYTKVAFDNLFDDTDKAEELINVLKDFSAVSPFDFSTSAKGVQRLLAYGIKAKNVMYVMQGVMNAATVQGDPSKIESISRAIGQIYTKGTLKAEELRQLAEAGIPAYEILSEKLNLTAEAMKNIGKAGIPASVAINALVDGINERFSGMAEASVSTMKGMISNIKDNGMMVLSGLFEPLYQQIRTVTHEVNEFFSSMYQLYELKGLGGMFEHIFPDKKTQASIRQLTALIQELGLVLLDVAANIRDIVVYSIRQLVNILNAIGPYIIFAGQVLQLFVRELKSCAPLVNILTTALAASAGAFIVFKTAALAAFVLKPLAQVVMLCARAFEFLAVMVTAHPLVLGLILLGGAIAGIAATSTKAGEAVRSFGEKLTKWLGIDPGKKILPDTKKRTADISKFNEALDTTSDMLDQTGDSAEKAGKKAKKAQKDLLSFDEVFRLNDNNDELNNSDNEVPAWEIPEIDLGSIGMDEPIIPDFADLWENPFQAQLDKLKNWGKSLWQRICDALGLDNPPAALFEAALGAGIAALLAKLLGASAWEVLAAGLMGFLAGLIWEKIAEAFGMDAEQRFEAMICTAFGIAFGALVGAILGLPVLGTIAAALGSGLIAEIWSGIGDAVGMAPEAKYAGVIAAGITALIAAAFSNALAGNGLFAVIGAFVPGFLDALALAFGNAAGGFSLLNTSATMALVATTISTLVQGFSNGDWSGLIPTLAGILMRVALGPLASFGGLIAGYLYNATFTSLKEKFGLSEGFRIADMLADFCTGIAEGIAKGFATYLIPGLAQATNAVSFSIVRGLQAGVLGAVVAIASSAISNILVGWLVDALNLTEQDAANGKLAGTIGGLCGTIIGGIVGFFVGGPAGAMIGMAVGNGIGQPLGAAIGTLWSTYIAPAFVSLGESIGNFFTVTLPATFANAATYITEALGNIGTTISNFFNVSIPEFLANAPSILNNALIAVWTPIREFASSLYDFFTKELPTTLGNAIGTLAGFLVGMIVKAFIEWNKFWSETVPNAVLGFIDAIPGIVVDIGNALASFNDRLNEWFYGVQEDIGAFIDSVVKTVGNFITVTIPNAVNSFFSFLASAPGRLATWAAEMIAIVVTNLGQLPNTILQIGNDVVNGFLNGLKAFPEAVGNFIKGFIDGFIGGFRKALGVESPSTVFYEIAGYVIEGFLNGLSAAWGAIVDWATTAVADFIGVFSDIGSNIATFVSSAKEKIADFASSAKEKLSSFASSAKESISSWVSSVKEKVSSFVSSTKESISSWSSGIKEKISSFTSTTKEKFSSWSSTLKSTFSTIGSTLKSSITSALSAATSVVSSKLSSISSSVSTFVSNISSKLSSLVSSASSAASSISDRVSNAASNVYSTASSGITSAFNTVRNRLTGHATGGVFDKEHIARFAEGNKAEAIIPLDNASAMQPFVDAVSSGLAQYLGPVMANMSNAISGNEQLQPVYVGTLIADDRSLRELQRKMQIIQLKETRRTS